MIKLITREHKDYEIPFARCSRWRQFRWHGYNQTNDFAWASTG